MKRIVIILCSLLNLAVAEFYSYTCINDRDEHCNGSFNVQLMSKNVSLGFPAEFQCVASCGPIAMAFNGILVPDMSDIQKEKYGISNNTVNNTGVGSLQLDGVTACSNNAHIECLCAASHPEGGINTHCCTEAILKVQGKLAAPGDLNVNSTVETIYLSWTAPSTLDIPDIDPDISQYTVYCNDTATNNNNIITTTPITNTSTTCFTFPCPSDIDPQFYTFSVSAWNQVGEGNRSDPMYGSCDSNRVQATPSMAEIFSVFKTADSFPVIKTAVTVTPIYTMDLHTDSPHIPLSSLTIVGLALIGAIVILVLTVAIVIAIICYIYRKKKKSQNTPAPALAQKKDPSPSNAAVQPQNKDIELL